jgi:hypothetical protein
MVLTKQDVKLASVICAPRWRRPRLRGLGVRIDDVGFEWNAQGDAPGGPETQGRQKGGLKEGSYARLTDLWRARI